MAYESRFTGEQIDGAIQSVYEGKDVWDAKQDAITGAHGQVVGFSALGKPVAQDMEPSLPVGGTAGQILSKASDADGDAEWVNPPETGVTSFNGRSGPVSPQSGDYTAEMVGARPSTWTPTAEDVGARPNTWTPTAAEVGALPDNTAIPSSTSELINDSGFITQSQLNAAIQAAIMDTWNAFY